MLDNKCIAMSALCMSLFIQGAANEPVAQPDSASIKSQALQLEDCFNTEKILTSGPERSYALLAVHKRLQKTHGWGLILHKEAEDKEECDLFMGCVGVVEGGNAELTEQIAALIKTSATQDTSWTPAKSAQTSKDVALWAQKLGHRYLADAFQDVTKGSFEEYSKIRDVSLSLVWFQCSKADVSPFELSRRYVNKPLRDVIMPLTLKRDCKFISECHPTKPPLEKLAKQVGSVSVSHEATVLRTIPEKIAAFVMQELGKKTD